MNSSKIIYFLIIIFISSLTVTLGAFNESELKRYFEKPALKHRYERYFSDPEGYQKGSMAYMKAIEQLPADKAKADEFMDILMHLDRILCEYIYKDKKIGEKEKEYLLKVYGDRKETQLRGKSAFLLYLKTDNVKYMYDSCKDFKLQISMFSEVYDSNYGPLLSMFVAGSFQEKIFGYKYKVNDSPMLHSEIVGINYSSITQSIFKHHLPDIFAEYLFDNIKYFQRFTAKIDHVSIANNLLQISDKPCLTYLASLMEQDMLDDLEQIATSDKRIASMVTAICERQITKYSVINDNISSAQNNGN